MRGLIRKKCYQQVVNDSIEVAAAPAGVGTAAAEVVAAAAAENQ